MTNRVEATTRYPLDKDRTEIGSGVNVAPQARVGLSLNTGRALKIVNLVIDYEHDVYSGDLGFTPGVLGAGLPATATTGQQIRKAWARFAFDRYLHLGGGITTSHWGMGLVANNGAQHAGHRVVRDSRIRAGETGCCGAALLPDLMATGASWPHSITTKSSTMMRF